MSKNIFGRDLDEWIKDYPLLEEIVQMEEVSWTNPLVQTDLESLALDWSDVLEAEERLIRFSPFIESAFPETKGSKGMIESPLVEVPKIKAELERRYQKNISSTLLMKCDNELPIAGSIKARGGIYEVLKIAEKIAINNKLLTHDDDYAKVASPPFRELFSNYSIAVGSTGNLGLSIGTISAKLGFQTTVHMSNDAKEWKKQLLKSKGVHVIEHEADYSEAVEQGRNQSELDESCFFIDDENSKDLFLGYAVAAIRLRRQLQKMDIRVDEQHPLVVYLPCGVGGGPGGITFGLKRVFGNHVHCYFAEPTHSPCMLIGMMTRLHDKVCVQDFGIDNKTDADGLAVGRPSSLVGKLMESLLSGIYTVQDKELYKLLSMLAHNEGIYLEPSALAGMYGPIRADVQHITNATHIVWATGGRLVPKEEMEKYVQKGCGLLLQD
ncbi:D-serine ammonia-lyase [Bacillus solimangrovi]|uniref:Probable D-serine dehydratase n=1 Tax=Bacillus solimangrovi TaxID=1305675 RepID=A0A1E5LGD6_9BACI|nr:D-serine ammonia-lyase [Bacillus solimangrovi]OEH93134.1 D-serine ammonia-lyase [Bacillus solimangrovi]